MLFYNHIQGVGEQVSLIIVIVVSSIIIIVVVIIIIIIITISVVIINIVEINQVGGLVDGLVDTVKDSPMFKEQLDRSDDMLIIRGDDWSFHPTADKLR